MIAVGSPSRPITITGFADAVTGNAGQFDVSLWGGVVINGNRITSQCNDTARMNDNCHLLSEGRPSHFGGDDNTESSGQLEYVIVKHTGFEAVPGDELNGITFNAVGAGTIVRNIQVFSTFDDGVEFFGGAVNVENLVALNVRDDSIDYTDGYVGTVGPALVIHHYRTTIHAWGFRGHCDSSRRPHNHTEQYCLRRSRNELSVPERSRTV